MLLKVTNKTQHEITKEKKGGGDGELLNFKEPRHAGVLYPPRFIVRSSGRYNRKKDAGSMRKTDEQNSLNLS